ncbi:DUF86 domain-containing protein [Methanobacterium sp.]|jgi:uncharacterized protein with HEPN domain|uniref:HepT-like ribonuclease domain-containing protein n=1 Tax=Methanobacterium sp. TaxID=2164 RepID=UPI0031583147
MTSNIFLDHILQSIELIEDYTKDITKEDFLNTNFVQEAVIRRIKIIGESVKNMPQDFKDKYSEIPWETIANVRDVLENEDCDLDVVWETVKSEIPVLKTEILKINEVKITY